MSEGTIRPAKPAATASWLTSGRRLTADVLSGRGGPAVPLAVLALAVLFPWWSGNIFWIRELTLIGLFALIISGLNVSFGYAGEVQFGQIAMFALGGYITAALANHITEIIPLLLISGAAAAILGALIALPALRLGGWALAMASFFLVILVPDVTGLLPGVTGGYIGLSGVPFPTFFGHPLGGTGLFETAVIAVAIWLAIVRNVVTSRFGNWLRVIRQSPVLALSLGMSVRRVKVTAYAFSAFPAGLARLLRPGHRDRRRRRVDPRRHRERLRCAARRRDHAVGPAEDRQLPAVLAADLRAVPAGRRPAVRPRHQRPGAIRRRPVVRAHRAAGNGNGRGGRTGRRRPRILAGRAGSSGGHFRDREELRWRARPR
jgi:hypothetical protein